MKNRHLTVLMQCLLVCSMAVLTIPPTSDAEPDWTWLEGVTISPTNLPIQTGPRGGTAQVTASSEAMASTQYQVFPIAAGGALGGYSLVVERWVFVDGHLQLQTLVMHWNGTAYVSAQGHQLIPCTPNATTGHDQAPNNVAHFIFQEPDGNGHSGYVRNNP